VESAVVFSDSDRKEIITCLDRLEPGQRDAALASFSAFAEWLSATLPDVHDRLRDDLALLRRMLRAVRPPQS
jgi:hypothetical protein